MPTSIVDPSFDLIDIIRTGVLTGATDLGTNFNFNINGSSAPSWAGSIANQFHFLCLLGTNTYILSANIDWSSLLIEIPDSAHILSVEIRCNGSIDCTAQSIDVADLHNNVISGTARQRITFSVEAPDSGIYTPVTDTNYSQDVQTTSGVVSTFNVSKILSDAGIVITKVWDFTSVLPGYITNDDLIAAFTAVQIKILGWTVIADATIFSNSHTGNQSLFASLQSSLWEMIITWEESWTIISILPNPAKPGDVVTITGTMLDLMDPLPDSIQWTDDAGNPQTIVITDAQLEDPQHIIFTVPPIATVPPTHPPFIGGGVTIYTGSVPLGPLTIYDAQGSGIYRIVANKRNDTLYDRSTDPISTEDVKIPDPFGETSFTGG